MNENSNKIVQKLRKLLNVQLTDSNGGKRKIIALYLGGSFGRHLSTESSDLDLILVVKPTNYDYLTEAKINCQKIYSRGHTVVKSLDMLPNDNTELFDMLPDLSDLVKQQLNGQTLTHIDIKLVSMPNFYKQLLRMTPDFYDLYQRGAIWTNNKLSQNESENLVAKLEAIPNEYKSVLNLNTYTRSLLGISNSVLHHMDTQLKMVDTIKYFVNQTKDLVENNVANVKSFEIKWLHNEPNYYHLAKSIKLNSDQVYQDGKFELGQAINYLVVLHDAVIKDLSLTEKQRKVQNIVTNIFLSNMKCC